MPGNDVTHPVPDNTGYITKGQFCLHSGVIDPFGNLWRLKQKIIGKVTRDQLLMRESLVETYFPKDGNGPVAAE